MLFSVGQISMGMSTMLYKFKNKQVTSLLTKRNLNTTACHCTAAADLQVSHVEEPIGQEELRTHTETSRVLRDL